MKRAAVLLLLAAMALSTASDACAVELIQLGTSSKYVKQLQEDLTELKLYDGKISGNAGEMTIEAVKAFQKKYNLTEDGIAGSSTLAKLEKVLGRTESKYGLSSSGESASSSKASGNEAVKTMQEGLKTLGLYTGEVTGNVGTKTEAAIRSFQHKYGLTVDGNAGSRTLAKLEEVLGGKSAAAAVSAPDDDVMTMQEGLKELGMYTGEITGNIGTKTEAAIRAFQKKYDLTENGAVSSETLAKLQSVLKGKSDSDQAVSSSADVANVTTVQAGLKELGMYTGEVTGNVGTKTEAAIRAFQEKYGLTVDGKVGSETLTKLGDVLSRKNSQTSAAAVEDVMTMQAGLKDLGLYYGEVTGNVGGKTEAAIRAFQDKYGLTVDGKVGSETLAKLGDVLSDKIGHASVAAVEDVMTMQAGLKDLGLYYGEVTGNVGAKTETAIRAFQKKYGLTVDGKVGSATLTTLSDVLSKKNSQASGALVEDVMAMQVGLKDLGLYYGEVTGNVGTKTEAAIRAFQKKYGLTVDGKVSSTTLAKLNDVLDGVKTGASSAAAVEDVMAMQAGLKELDFYYGEVTGNVGTKTEAAIRAFQKKYGLTVNGEVDSATLAKLDAVLGSAEEDAAAAADVEDVMTMQAGLKELDLYYGEITGNIGTKTEAAIRAFQKKYGLTVDGKIGSETLAKLNDVLSGEDADAADPDDVKTMQEGLKTLGLYYADVTGNIGTKTEAAIRAFQEKYGLNVNGEVNSATLAKLKEVLSSGSAGGAILDLHWFDDKSYYTSHGVKKGLTITIMDVKTGKQFNARVQSTGYHADVEPQTAADTEIMCDIYGVSKASDISYVRRPVIIKTNVYGRRYNFAGSMYGEPHGSQVVTNNNYDGQFCIHFRHSTTSGSQVEYEMNQSPIDSAVNYAVNRLGMEHITDVDDAP